MIKGDFRVRVTWLNVGSETRLWHALYYYAKFGSDSGFARAMSSLELDRSSPSLNSASSPSAAPLSASPPLTAPPWKISRRRPTPAQLQALRNVFSTNSHPTREERVALADEIGMYVTSLLVVPTASEQER